MSNLMDTDLRKLKFAYAYMQSMPIILVVYTNTILIRLLILLIICGIL